MQYEVRKFDNISSFNTSSTCDKTLILYLKHTVVGDAGVCHLLASTLIVHVTTSIPMTPRMGQPQLCPLSMYTMPVRHSISQPKMAQTAPKLSHLPLSVRPKEKMRLTWTDQGLLSVTLVYVTSYSSAQWTWPQVTLTTPTSAPVSMVTSSGAGGL